MNNCQAGHSTHNRKVVYTTVGEMTIYDWVGYMGFKGYCPGQDDVSMTLDNTGVWDLEIDKRVREILAAGDKSKLVVDVGAHIGYFSRLAVSLGYQVEAFEGEDEHIELLKLNVPEAGVNYVWFSEHTTPWLFRKEIELLKIDVEGSEKFVINYFEHCLDNVKNIIIEVSPIFNDDYPALIQKLVDKRFSVYELDGSPFDFSYKFPQKDLWLKKI